MPTTLIQVAPTASQYTLVLHGGAGGRVGDHTDAELAAYRAGLRDAYQAGIAVLAGGGAALDAVCTAVCSMEDNPLFNAGRGAALTAAGAVELDALVMDGAGRSGAVTVNTCARHPVLAARAVAEHTRHALLLGPDRELLASWGVELADPSWFITPARQQQLTRVQAGQEEPMKHGTVGCAALDAQGHLAAATSTGGITNQFVGRVGDTPIAGAGTFARNGMVALSCTGIGEAFLQGCVAHDVYARMAYGHQTLAQAADEALAHEVEGRGADGGLVAIGADGRVVIAHNSDMMYAAWFDGHQLATQV